MKMRQAPNEGQNREVILSFLRHKAAIVLMGLVAPATGSQACKASLQFNLNTAEEARKAAVEEHGFKSFYISEAEAIVLLKRVEKMEGAVIEGIVDISPHSPLQANPGELLRFKLPESAHPWVEFVYEPSGRMTLRLEGDEIGLDLECTRNETNKNSHCIANEIEEPKRRVEEIDNPASAASDSPPALQVSAEAEQTTPMTTPLKTSRISDTTISIPEDTDRKIKQLMPPINALSWDEQKALARELAGDDAGMKRYAEEAIKTAEESTTGDLVRIDVVDKRFPRLLAYRPDMLATLATRYGITFEEEKKTSERGGSDAEKPASESVSVDLVEFKRLLDAHRRKLGLPGLTYGECALKMAEYWAKHPAAPDSDGHAAGDETLETRMNQAACATTAVENVSWPDNFEPAHIFQQWKDSPPHRANMEKRGISEMGLHCVKGTGAKNGNFCVMAGVRPK